MKQTVVLLLGLALTASTLSAQSSDPVLMKINGKNIPLSEFEYIYNKNNSNNVIDKKTLEEYADLFVNFKLKVEEAIAQGLDTTQTFKNEFNMYRNQLAEQYLTDEKKRDELLRQAYNRKTDEVEVRHLLVRIPDPGTSADTLAAYNKALTLYQRAQKEDFEKLARTVSDDPSAAKNGGYVGWISAMRTPYSFENMAYSTPVGKISKPVRTFLGYHIIKVLNKRPSPGEVKVAHILLMNNREDPTKNGAVKQQIDSIYRLIQSGQDFGDLAVHFSQDPGSVNQKGELPWFGSGQMIPEFEKAAFALTQKGEVSAPILSQYGWHIIQLVDKKPIDGFEAMKSKLETEIKQNERNQAVNESFINSLKKQYNFRVNEPALADFKRIADKHAPGDSLFVAETKTLHAPLAFFADKTLTQSEFSNYLSTHPTNRSIRADLIANAFEQFAAEQLKGYEMTRLAAKYPDYRNLVNEYHDGILLFEVMNKEVWDKASKDTEGLSAYFNANRAKYTWDKPHYKGRVLFAKDKETLQAAQNIVKRADKDSIDTYLNRRLNDSIQYIKVEKGLWIAGENPVVDDKIFRKAKYTPEEAYPFVAVIGKKLGTKPEEYTDVRGLVTADYQDFLEKQWIDYLRKKYPVEIDQNVLKAVKSN